MSEKFAIISWLGFALAFFACEPTPQPIQVGQDNCAYCKMLIVDDRYGAEIVSRKGKVFKYDSIECMTAALLRQDIPEDKVHTILVVDFEKPGNLLPVSQAVFVRSRTLRSPMGLNLSAFQDTAIAERIMELYYGQAITWEDVQEYVRESWME
jgi:copper chaperone NosL